MSYDFITLNIAILWILILLLLALSFKRVGQPLNASVPALKKLPVGQIAPDFSALALDGSSVNRSIYAERDVCFIFVQPHCESCRAKIPTLNRLYAKARTHGVELVLVCISDLESAKTMVSQLNIGFTVLASNPGSTTLSIQFDPSLITPFFCLINKKSIVVSTGLVNSRDWNQLELLWESK